MPEPSSETEIQEIREPGWGSGIGQGGKAPFEETDTGFTPDKVQSPLMRPLQGMFSFKGQAQGESISPLKDCHAGAVFR